MYNRLTRRRKLYLLVFIVILLTALWLLIRPRPTTAQVLGASVTDVRVVSYDPRELIRLAAEFTSDVSAEHERATAKAVVREQVWAGLVRAVDFLLEEAESRIDDEYYRAVNSDDQERVARLNRRLQVVRSLRKQVEASPDGPG